MKILDTVIGSNQRFIQPQTVGKKVGAPMICNYQLALSSNKHSVQPTYENAIQRLRVMRRRQLRSILHMSLQIPKLLQSHSADVDNIIALGNGRLGMFPGDGGAQGLYKPSQRLI
jgi:hypothetical protein